MKSTTLLLIHAQTNEQGTELQQAANQQETASAQETHTTQAEPPAGGESAEPQKPSSWGNYIFLILLIFIVYFFMIRPNSKRAKEERKFREALKKGDKIVTTSGIYGKIIELDETTAIIETEGQGKLKIEKAAIMRSVNPENK